jgi:hypothetical protein
MKELKERKRFGQKGATMASLEAAFPGVERILQVAARKGENVGNFVAGLTSLRNTLGDEVLSLALTNALEREFFSFVDIRREVDSIQMARRTPPPIPDPLLISQTIPQRMSEITSLEQYKIQ